MLKKLLVIILVSQLLFTGCAALFKGSMEEVNFSTDPSGASIYINGQYMGLTPMSTLLESKKSYNVEFRLDGYRTKTNVIGNSVGAAWVILDILGGLLPVIIDAATGAWYGLNNTNIVSALEKE